MASEAAAHGPDIASVVILLAAAVIAVPLFKRLGLGAVLGYLAAGLAIGPWGFGFFTDAMSSRSAASFWACSSSPSAWRWIWRWSGTTGG